MGAGFDSPIRTHPGRPAQPGDRLAQAAGARRGGLRRDRHLRHLGRHPRGRRQRHRLDEPDGLPRQGLPLRARRARRQRPRLLAGGRQLHRDGGGGADVPPGPGPLPEFDELGRPAWLFGETVHRHCVRAGYYEEGVFAKEYGDKECLVEIGCWGPVVQCNITERGAINHMGGCMVAGGAASAARCPASPTSSPPSTRRRPARRLGRHLAGLRRGDPPAAPHDHERRQPRAALGPKRRGPERLSGEASKPPLTSSRRVLLQQLQYRGRSIRRNAAGKQPNPRSQQTSTVRRRARREGEES